MDMLLLLFSCIVWLFAGFINGVTSFGGNMVAVPLMALVMEPRTAIVFCCLVGSSIPVTLTILYRKGLPKREFLLIGLFAVLGLLPGMWLLKAVPVQILLFLSGCILVLFLVWQFVSRRLGRELSVPLWTAAPAGFLTGLLLACTGMGGPVMGMYAVLRGWSKETTLFTLNALGAVMMVVLVVLQWGKGLYTPDIFEGALWGIPCSVAGVLLSIPVIRRIDTRVFRLCLLGMLAVSAAVLFFRSMA